MNKNTLNKELRSNKYISRVYAPKTGKGSFSRNELKEELLDMINDVSYNDELKQEIYTDLMLLDQDSDEFKEYSVKTKVNSLMFELDNIQNYSGKVDLEVKVDGQSKIEESQEFVNKTQRLNILNEFKEKIENFKHIADEDIDKIKQQVIQEKQSENSHLKNEVEVFQKLYNIDHANHNINVKINELYKKLTEVKKKKELDSIKEDIVECYKNSKIEELEAFPDSYPKQFKDLGIDDITSLISKYTEGFNSSKKRLKNLYKNADSIANENQSG